LAAAPSPKPKNDATQKPATKPEAKAKPLDFKEFAPDAAGPGQ
jgi:hypothetical protein